MILSMIGMTKNTPGPLAPTQRPSRKMTPRSYSWTILIDEAKNRISEHDQDEPDHEQGFQDCTPSVGEPDTNGMAVCGLRIAV